jgi:hypothetical protein
MMPEEKKRWVDFAAVKAAVSLIRGLAHYGINHETEGWGWNFQEEEFRGPCPLPECGGKRSFSVNVPKNTFHCFACKARGNVLDFVAKMEGCTIRDAALRLAEWFKVGESEQQAAGQSEGVLTRLHKLITELEEHLEQSANHLALAEEKRAAIRMLVVELDKGG